MALLVTIKELADAVDLTERRINQLVSEGVLERGNDGKFDIFLSIESYIKNKYGIESNLSYDIERARHEKIKREMAELKLAKLEGSVYDAGIVESVITGMIVTCRNKLLGIPSKLAPQLIGQKNINKISQLIDNEIRAALEELAEFDPAMFMDVGDEFEEEGEED